MIAFIVLFVFASLVLAHETCQAPPPSTHNYSSVFSQGRKHGIAFEDLPGFTRSTYQRDHALITPESRVWAPQPGWKNAVTSHLISPASGGANFAMLLADMRAGSVAGKVAAGAERFILVLNGEASITLPDGSSVLLGHNDYAYFPPSDLSTLSSTNGAGLLLYERIYSIGEGGAALFTHGHVEDSPLLPTAPEVFELRKLLPQTGDYDFNIHVMDFKPGEYLLVKEVHYNQHGLMLLEGQGIYRLGDNWYPVQSGDSIWMAPFVPQWYAALGSKSTRYIIYKDTTLDPLV